MNRQQVHTSFTPEELDELRRFDDEVDASPVLQEDYETMEFVEELLGLDPITRRREYQRAYYAEHREKERERHRRYYWANREKYLAQKKASREQRKRNPVSTPVCNPPTREEIEACREKSRAYDKKYRDANKEIVAARKALWYQKNKARIAEQHMEYRKKNREKIAAYKKEYYLQRKAKKAAEMDDV